MKETNVLVAYATKYGATGEIAQAIGEVVGDAGYSVDVLAVEEVGDLTSYGAVVLGSAVYAGMWRKGMVGFLEDNETALRERPTWLFSSGPTGSGDPVELLDGWTVPEAQQAIVSRIRPRAVTVFHGAIEPDKLNFGEKLIVKAVRGETGDFRDWDAIRAWAGQIASALP